MERKLKKKIKKNGVMFANCKVVWIGYFSSVGNRYTRISFLFLLGTYEQMISRRFQI